MKWVKDLYNNSSWILVDNHIDQEVASMISNPKVVLDFSDSMIWIGIKPPPRDWEDCDLAMLQWMLEHPDECLMFLLL